MGNDPKNGIRPFVDIFWSREPVWFSILPAHMQKSTRIGLWLYAKFDPIVDYLIARWGWTWLQSTPRMHGGKSILVTKKKNR